jgi:hypothetical protein
LEGPSLESLKHFPFVNGAPWAVNIPYSRRHFATLSPGRTERELYTASF